MLFEKRLIEALIGLIFLIFLVVVEKKTVAKALILILPISFQTRYGQVNNFLILGIAAYYLVFTIKKKDFSQFSITVHLFLILLVYVCSFALNFSNLDFSKGYLNSPHTDSILAILSSVALFRIIFSSIDSRKDIEDFLVWMIVAYFLSSIATVIQLIIPSYMQYLTAFIQRQEIAESSWRGLRVYGTLGGYEAYAEYTAIILMLLVAFITISDSYWKKYLCVGLTIVTFYFLLMTKTRGPLVSLSVALIYVIVIHFKSLGLRRVVGAVLLGALLVGGVGYKLASNDDFNSIDMLVNKTEIDISKGDFDTRSNTWRIAVEEYSKSDFFEHLVGRGPGLVSHTKLLTVYPHSLYLYLLNSLGIFGLVVYLFWFSRIILARLPENQTEYYAILVAFLKASLILFFVDQIKIEFVRTSSFQHIVWALFAITFAAVYKVPRTEKIELQ